MRAMFSGWSKKHRYVLIQRRCIDSKVSAQDTARSRRTGDCCVRVGVDMRKSVLGVLLAVLFVLSPAVSGYAASDGTAVWPETGALRAEHGIMYSSLGDGTCILVDGVGSEESVAVPDEVGGCTVVEIADFAFFHTGHSQTQVNTKLREISLPDTIKRIGERAFGFCENLAKIEIPGSVEEIADYAFVNSGLVEAVIQPGMKKLGAGAFNICSYLEKIELPEGLESIGELAFANCRRLTEIRVPNGVKSIGERAFRNCSGLTSIALSDTVEEMGAGALQNCANLSEVRLSAGLRRLEPSLFGLGALPLPSVSYGGTEDQWVRLSGTDTAYYTALSVSGDGWTRDQVWDYANDNSWYEKHGVGYVDEENGLQAEIEFLSRQGTLQVKLLDARNVPEDHGAEEGREQFYASPAETITVEEGRSVNIIYDVTDEDGEIIPYHMAGFMMDDGRTDLVHMPVRAVSDQALIHDLPMDIDVSTLTPKSGDTIEVTLTAKEDALLQTALLPVKLAEGTKCVLSNNSVEENPFGTASQVAPAIVGPKDYRYGELELPQSWTFKATVTGKPGQHVTLQLEGKCVCDNSTNSQWFVEQIADLVIAEADGSPSLTEEEIRANQALLVPREGSAFRWNGVHMSAPGPEDTDKAALLAAEVLGAFAETPEGTIEILRADTTPVGPEEMVGTGDILRVTRPDGTAAAQARIVIPGDVTGSGEINLTEVTVMAQAVLGERTLAGPYLTAGDWNGNGTIDLTDLVREVQVFQ